MGSNELEVALNVRFSPLAESRDLSGRFMNGSSPRQPTFNPSRSKQVISPDFEAPYSRLTNCF
jgi:hypothetical protein